MCKETDWQGHWIRSVKKVNLESNVTDIVDKDGEDISGRGDEDLTNYSNLKQSNDKCFNNITKCDNDMDVKSANETAQCEKEIPEQIENIGQKQETRRLYVVVVEYSLNFY